MFGIFVILFIFIPLLELTVLIQAGTVIGVFNTVGLIILTGVLGASLARYQGLQVYFNIQQDLNAGRMPADKLLDGVLILAAGLVLLTPGFITDAAGFFLLWPGGRNLFKRWLRKQFTTHTSDPEHPGNIRYFRQDDL